MDGSDDRIGSEGFARPPGACALYAIVAFTTVGDNVRGAQFAVTSGVAAAESGSPTAQAEALYARGFALKSTSPMEAAAELQRAADIARDCGNRWIQAFALTQVLWLEAREGRAQESIARYINVIDLWYRGGDWANQWLSLRHVFRHPCSTSSRPRGGDAPWCAHRRRNPAYALPFEAADAQRISALVDDSATGSELPHSLQRCAEERV